LNCGLCVQGAPKAVASRTPFQGFTGAGSRQRSAPTGGSAKGMPLKAAPPFSSAAPCTSPPVTATIGPDPAAGGVCASTKAGIVRAFAQAPITTNANPRRMTFLPFA
jgi:hypothetical protein